MTDLTSDYIRIKQTDKSTWEMKVLSINDSTKVICTVSTVCGPVCDSSIDFYTTDWQRVPASEFLELPVMDDFFQLSDSARLDDYTNYRNKMDMLLVKANLSKEEQTLTFTLTTPGYVGSQSGDEEKEIVDTAAFLHEPLVYVWVYEPEMSSSHFRLKEN